MKESRNRKDSYTQLLPIKRLIGSRYQFPLSFITRSTIQPNSCNSIDMILFIHFSFSGMRHSRMKYIVKIEIRISLQLISCQALLMICISFNIGKSSHASLLSFKTHHDSSPSKNILREQIFSRVELLRENIRRKNCFSCSLEHHYLKLSLHLIILLLLSKFRTQATNFFIPLKL